MQNHNCVIVRVFWRNCPYILFTCCCLYFRLVDIYTNSFVNYYLFIQMLAHRLFPNARYSIWVDSKSQFRRDPLGVLEALLWRSNHELAISEHGARSSVYDEAKAVVHKNKATPAEVEVQLAQYRRDGLPEDKRFNGKKGIVFLARIYSITILDRVKSFQNMMSGLCY